MKNNGLESQCLASYTAIIGQIFCVCDQANSKLSSEIALRNQKSIIFERNKKKISNK